jgi:hypothetical protein
MNREEFIKQFVLNYTAIKFANTNIGTQSYVDTKRAIENATFLAKSLAYRVWDELHKD